MPLRYKFDETLVGDKFKKVPKQVRENLFRLLEGGLSMAVDGYLMHRSKVDYSELYFHVLKFEESDLEKFEKYAKEKEIFIDNNVPSKDFMRWFVGYEITRTGSC